MKSRAGTVGRKGVANLLRQGRALKPAIRIHLVGHAEHMAARVKASGNIVEKQEQKKDK